MVLDVLSTESLHTAAWLLVIDMFYRQDAKVPSFKVGAVHVVVFLVSGAKSKSENLHFTAGIRVLSGLAVVVLYAFTNGLRKSLHSH
jgi:hypothetical protein